MDFGEVLDQWEKIERERARHKGVACIRGDAPDPVRIEEEGRRNAFEAWLDGHEIADKDALSAREGGSRSGAELRAEREEASRRFAAQAPQATIDLHGMRAREAEAALLAFLEDSGKRGLEKVLVVHGKGNHSADGPVLGKVARRAIEESHWAGRSGEADRAQGGSGALWVALRRPVGRAR